MVNAAAPTVTPKNVRREVAIGYLDRQRAESPLRYLPESAAKFDTVCRRCEGSRLYWNCTNKVAPWR